MDAHQDEHHGDEERQETLVPAQEHSKAGGDEAQFFIKSKIVSQWIFIASS